MAAYTVNNIRLLYYSWIWYLRPEPVGVFFMNQLAKDGSGEKEE